MIIFELVLHTMNYSLLLGNINMIVFGIVILLWLYLLYVLKRTKLNAFFFIVGSIGLFLIILTFKDFFIQSSIKSVLYTMKSLSFFFKGYSISMSRDFVSFYDSKVKITYEYTGVIEIISLESLLCFFPIYTVLEKIIIGFYSCILIFIATILRLLLIIYLSSYLGETITQLIICRLLFYVFIVVVFYEVFTRSQIIRWH